MGVRTVQAKHHGRAAGYTYGCRCDLCKEWSKNRYQKVRETTLARHRLVKYGLSTSQILDWLVGQGAGCAICQEYIDFSAHIDHDHTTGRVRGLLCAQCNLGLGKFRDNSDYLRRAAQYLEG